MNSVLVLLCSIAVLAVVSADTWTYCEFNDLFCGVKDHCQDLNCNGGCYPFGEGGAYYHCSPTTFQGRSALNISTTGGSSCQSTMVPSPCNWCNTMGGFSLGTWCNQQPPANPTTSTSTGSTTSSTAGNVANLCQFTDGTCGGSKGQCASFTCDGTCRAMNGQWYTCGIGGSDVKVNYFFDNACKSAAPSFTYQCNLCEYTANLEGGFYQMMCPPSASSMTFDSCQYFDNQCSIKGMCSPRICDGKCYSDQMTFTNYKCTFNSATGAVSTTYYHDPSCSMSAGGAVSSSCGACMKGSDGVSYYKHGCVVNAGSSSTTGPASTSTSSSTTGPATTTSSSSSSTKTTTSSSSSSSSMSTSGSSTTTGSATSTTGQTCPPTWSCSDCKTQCNKKACKNVGEYKSQCQSDCAKYMCGKFC